MESATLVELRQLASQMANWSHRKKNFLYRMTGGLCWYCGKTANSLDHMIPASRGGSNAYGNVVPACRSCNTNKSDMTVAEFRLRKQPGYIFWGEQRGYDPCWPLYCMSWRGSFGQLHEHGQSWPVSLWYWLRRKYHKQIRLTRKRLRRLLYGSTSR